MAATVEDNAAKPHPNAIADKENELLIELGIWLSGLETFLISGQRCFGGGLDVGDGDAAREFQLVHATILRCLLLSARIAVPDPERELHEVLREGLALSKALMGSNALGSVEWLTWSGLFLGRLQSAHAFHNLIHGAEIAGERFLPPVLLELVAEPRNAEHAEMALVLPHFGKVLKWLSVVGNMLARDEPLKPALLIFARVNEQIQELTLYINSRVEQFADEDVEIFASLDAAAYTAAIEVKKVYMQELAGLARVRPAPSIHARMETAHSLLNEGFQQILVGFARPVDPSTDVFELFPNFRKKRDDSIVLRSEISSLITRVRAAEQLPKEVEIAALEKQLRAFMKETVTFLFYKDSETVERFVEEILVTPETKDLVPMLHRFGAYLETLFGQVNLRAVLVKHPFQEDRANH